MLLVVVERRKRRANRLQAVSLGVDDTIKCVYPDRFLSCASAHVIHAKHHFEPIKS